MRCYALPTAGKKEFVKVLHLDADCVGFFDLMTRRSSRMVHAGAACTSACQECGAECDKFKMLKLNDCAGACRDCEAACCAMVKPIGKHHR
jgi:hypothetical protein